MTTIKKHRFISSVSSLALLSLFFVGGISKAQSAFDASFEETMQQEARRRTGLPTVNITGSRESAAQSARRLAQRQSIVRSALGQIEESYQSLDVTVRDSQGRLTRLQEEEREIFGLTERVSELEQNLGDAQSARALLESQMAQLRAELLRVNSSLRIATQSNEGLQRDSELRRQDLQTTNTQLQDLQVEKDEQEAKVTALTADLEREVGLKEKFSKQASKLRAKKETLESQAADLQRQIAEKGLELTEATQQVTQLKTELASAREEVESSSRRLAQIQTEKEALQEELKSAQQNLVIANTRVEELEINLEEIRQKKDKIRKQLFTLVGGLGVLDDLPFDTLIEGVELDAFLEKVQSDLQGRFLMAQRSLQDLEDQKNDLFQANQSQQKLMQEKEAEFMQRSQIKDRQIEDLNKSISRLEEEIRVITTQRNSLEESLEKAQRELEDSKDKNARLQETVDALAKERALTALRIESLVEEIEVLTRERTSLEEAKKQLEDLLKKAVALANKDSEALRKDIATLEQQLADLRTEAENSRKTLEARYAQELDSLKQNYEESLQQAKEKVRETENRLSHEHNQLDELTRQYLVKEQEYQAQLEGVRARLKEAEKQFETLGHEHGAEVERLKAQQTTLQSQWEAEKQGFELDVTKQAKRILTLEENLKKVQEEQEKEQETFKEQHANEVKVLEATHQQKVAELTGKLTDSQKELGLAKEVLTQTLTATENERMTFKTSMATSAQALRESQEQNSRDREELETSYRKLMEGHEQRHQQALHLMKEQLQAQATQILEKDQQIAQNLEDLKTNAEGIQKIRDLLNEGEGEEIVVNNLDDVHYHLECLLEAGTGSLEEQEETKNALKALEDERTRLREKNEGLRQDLSALEQSKKNCDLKIKDLETAHLQNKKELERDLEKSLQANKDLERQFNKSQQILQEIQTAYDSLDIVLDSDSSSSEDGNSPLAMTKRLVTLVHSLKSAEQSLNSQFADLEDHVQRLEKEKHCKQDSLTQVEQEHSEQLNRFKEVQETLNLYLARIHGLEKDLQEHQDTIQRKESEHSLLETKLIAQNSEIDELRDTVRDLTDQKSSLEEQIQTLEDELGSQEDKMIGFKTQLSQLNVSLDRSLQDTIDSELTVQDIDDLIREKQDQIAGQKREFLEITEDLRKQLAEKEGQLKAARSETNSVREGADLQIRVVNEAADRRIKEIESLIETLRARLSDQQRECDAKENEHSLAKKSLESIRTQLRESLANVQKTKEELNQKKSELDEVQAVCAQLTETLESKSRLDSGFVSGGDSSVRNYSELLQELAEAKKSLQETRAQKDSLQMLVEKFNQQTEAVRGDSAVTNGPRTPFKAGSSDQDSYKTPVQGASSEAVSKQPVTPGRSMFINPRTPLSQGMTEALRGFQGGIGAHNQADVLKALLGVLQKAGVEVEMNLDNPLFSPKKPATPRSILRSSSALSGSARKPLSSLQAPKSLTAKNLFG